MFSLSLSLYYIYSMWLSFLSLMQYNTITLSYVVCKKSSRSISFTVYCKHRTLTLNWIIFVDFNVTLLSIEWAWFFFNLISHTKQSQSKTNYFDSIATNAAIFDSVQHWLQRALWTVWALCLFFFLHHKNCTHILLLSTLSHFAFKTNIHIYIESARWSCARLFGVCL